MTKRIYVGNLSSHTTERDLISLFERIGQVVSVRIMTDRDTGRSKGFGFIEMGNGDAERAITQLNQTDLNGHTLSVTAARARPEPSAASGLPVVRLFVGNLPYNATAAELREYFSSVGLVSAVSLPVERETGKPRGFAFVEFPDRAHAEEAVRRFHNQPFKGRALVVNEAHARESRSPTDAPSRSFHPPVERPAAAPLTSPLDERLDERQSRRRGLRRNFGPDAAPQRNRKQTGRGSKSERSFRKPIPEKKSGQFFGTDDDESYGEVFTQEHLASQTSDPESDEQP
jgi:cold-inducible RNA-binding protein